MKGRITCPKCEHKFVLDLEKDKEKYSVKCPNCNHNFNVKIKCKDENKEECDWQEHGEPRKTVLSSIKPRTNKPIIATIILVVIFSIGISTAAFSEAFIESTFDIISFGGGTGTVEIKLSNQNNQSIENATIILDGMIINKSSNGIYNKNNVELGIQDITIQKEGYNKIKTEIIIIPFIKSESKFILQNNTGAVKKTEFDSFGCSLILGIFSLFSLFAIITCIKREHLDVAIASCLLGAFSFGFFFIGTILSIIAFIFIWKSRDEFKNGEKGKIF